MLLERHAARESSFGELDVAPERVVDAGGPADLAGRRADVLDLAAEDEVLDPLLDLVVELVAVVPEELDAVVFVGIVRGAESTMPASARSERVM